VENCPHFSHVIADGAVEFFRRGKTETARKPAERIGVFRDGMGLLFRFDLEPVFDSPQKTVGIFEDAHFLVRQKLEVRQDRQHFKGACVLEKSVARAVQQLEGLDDKLDLADSSRTQLHVALNVFVANDVAFDPPLNAADLFQNIAGGTLWKNERLMLPEKFVSQLTTSGDTARLDQSEPFPGLAEPRIIIFHTVDRTRERPGRTFRPQSQIDPEQRAGRIVGRKGLDNFRAQLVEPLVISQVRRNLAFFGVNKNHVDIRAVV
jgi:hypothetical protein